VNPEKALLDEPIDISISNLLANEQLLLELSSKDADGGIWKSHATFQANNKGVINVTKQAPLCGSYKGIDPMGLFWSMAPIDTDSSKNTFMSRGTVNLCEVLLSVSSKGTLRAQKIIRRLFFSPDVEKKDIREEGIVGTLFYPKNMKKSPGLITIPGSGGMIPESISQFIASHGYTVLALAYFGAEGLPKSLSLIPLEYFQNAMRWLKKQPQVESGKIALMGHSRGAEVVLLLASLFPGEMAGVIAVSGPSLVYGDFSPEKKSAWTYKNIPIPCMPYVTDQEIFEAIKAGHIIGHSGTIKDPFRDAQTFLYGINMKKYNNMMKKAAIPVENIRCPLLIISGDDDAMWPSAVFGKRIMERLDAHGSIIKKRHSNYPHAGHYLFTFPYAPSIDLPVPMASGWSLLGGTPQGNAYAIEQSWKEMLEFLKEM
jgi:dienelactone hydrolase